MKTIGMVAIIMSCAATSFAGIGETREETIKRYGEPTYWSHDLAKPANLSSRAPRRRRTSEQNSTNATHAVYTKEEPNFWVSFFVAKDGRRIAGQITYRLPTELGRNADLAAPVIHKLLEANADGHPWTEDDAPEMSKRLRRTFQREGASALLQFGRRLTVSLDEYSEFVKTEQKRLAAEQAEKMSGDAKGQ